MHYTLTDLVTDIAQNGAESGANTLELHINEAYYSPDREEFCFKVKDNGKGMSDLELKYAGDPFVNDGIKHPHRKAGLGLPFLIQTAECSGGGWEMESGIAEGTTVRGRFDLCNVDTPPVGDLPGMFRTILLFLGPDEVVIQRAVDGELIYQIKKNELIYSLGPLEDAESLILLDTYLRSIEENLIKGEAKWPS